MVLLGLDDLINFVEDRLFGLEDVVEPVGLEGAELPALVDDALAGEPGEKVAIAGVDKAGLKIESPAGLRGLVVAFDADLDWRTLGENRHAPVAAIDDCPVTSVFDAEVQKLNVPAKPVLRDVLRSGRRTDALALAYPSDRLFKLCVFLRAARSIRSAKLAGPRVTSGRRPAQATRQAALKAAAVFCSVISGTGHLECSGSNSERS